MTAIAISHYVYSILAKSNEDLHEIFKGSMCMCTGHNVRPLTARSIMWTMYAYTYMMYIIIHPYTDTVIS